MRSTYSSVDSARPASTSSDELVTPPVRRYCLEGSLPRATKATYLVGTLILEQAHFPHFEVKAFPLRGEEIGSFHNILEVGLPSESTSAATFETLTASGLASISRYKAHELAKERVSHHPPQGTKRSALKRKCAPFRKSVPSGTISPAVRKKG